MPPRRIAVCLEVTPKQAVASALDWPGWCRAGRDEGAALEALASYAGRYALVAAHAGVSFPAAVAFDVVERVPGGPATAFAAPECRRPFPQITAGAEWATVTQAAARRLAGCARNRRARPRSEDHPCGGRQHAADRQRTPRYDRALWEDTGVAARSSRAAPVQRRQRQLGGQSRHTLSVFAAGQPITDRTARRRQSGPRS